jgi:hypothetical protein
MPKRNNQFSAIVRVVAVGDEQTFPSGFRKREVLVCDDDPKYPQTFPVEFSGDNTDRAASFAPGDHIAVEFSIRGHQTSSGRAFVTLRGFKVERAVKIGGESVAVPNDAAPAPAPAPMPPSAADQAAPATNPALEELPF